MNLRTIKSKIKDVEEKEKRQAENVKSAREIFYNAGRQEDKIVWLIRIFVGLLVCGLLAIFTFRVLYNDIWLIKNSIRSVSIGKFSYTTVLPDGEPILENARNANPHIYPNNIQVERDAQDNHVYHYTCEITPAGSTAISLLIDGYLGPQYHSVKPVEISGTLRITDDSIFRKVIIEEENPLFYLIYHLAYLSPDDFVGGRIPTLSDDLDLALFNYASVVAKYYANAQDKDHTDLITETIQEADSILRSASDANAVPVYSNDAAAISKIVRQNLEVINSNPQLKGYNRTAVTISLGLSGLMLAGLLASVISLFANRKKESKLRNAYDHEDHALNKIKLEYAELLKLKGQEEYKILLKRLEDDIPNYLPALDFLQRIYSEKVSDPSEEEQERMLKTFLENLKDPYDDIDLADIEYLYKRKDIEEEDFEVIAEKAGLNPYELACLLHKKTPQKSLLDTMIALTLNPFNDMEILKQLRQVVAENSSYHENDGSVNKVRETLFGWAMAAYARCKTLDQSPDGIQDDNILDDIFDQYNAILKERQEKVKEYKKALDEYEKLKESTSQDSQLGEGILGNSPYPGLDAQMMEYLVPQQLKGLETQLRSFIRELQELDEKLDGGIIRKCMQSDEDVFFKLSFYLIGSSISQQYSSFMLQSLVVGLLPFMLANKDHAEIETHFKNLVAMRGRLINWDNDLSFFEVRVSDDCNLSAYKNVLKEVLTCANPSLQYADVSKTIDILRDEVPHILDLLKKYPLRLIDISNKSTEGFYKFDPFKHLLVTNYQPPINQGPVNSRFHKIVDLTLPNSVGINLRLFTDHYSTIPVLFHEYCHYLGNRNEAEVFMMTQHFSEYFYDKYEDAGETLLNNYTYVHLKKEFADKTNAEQINLLNKLIEKYYGKEMPLTTAKRQAAMNVMNVNGGVAKTNAQQTWHPEVSYPMLNSQQDREKAGLTIYNALIRFLSASKQIRSGDYGRLEKEWQKIKDGRQSYPEEKLFWDDLEITMKNLVPRGVSRFRAPK